METRRESSGSQKQADQNDRPLPTDALPETFATLLGRLETNHMAERRTWRLKLGHLREAFRDDERASSITPDRLRTYVIQRQGQGAADATIRQELANLHAAFTLAGMPCPKFPIPTVNNVRECWFTVAELDLLLTLLPIHFRGRVEFAALTGWRRADILGLTWDQIDFETGEVRTPIGVTKNGEPFVTPFAVGSRLNALLREQRRVRGGEKYVFDQRDIRTAWARAVGPKGLNKWGRQFDTRIGTVKPVRPRFHDMRHTFAQHADEAGIDQTTLLELGTWKTPEMLNRYRIKNTRAKRDALAKRDAYLKSERVAAASAPKVVSLVKRRTGTRG
jgi:integrase